MLERISDDIWVEHRPLRFFGVETGARMIVVRGAEPLPPPLRRAMGRGVSERAPPSLSRPGKEAQGSPVELATMKRTVILTLAALLILSACGPADKANPVRDVKGAADDLSRGVGTKPKPVEDAAANQADGGTK
jgi:hypothetical protein